MQELFYTRTTCRACSSSALELAIDLGKTPLANSFLKKEELQQSEPYYPLRVFVCQDCWFVQLADIVHPNILFRDYIYFSTGVASVPEHFREYADEVVRHFAPSKESFVVEIGSNDGVLIGAIQSRGPRVLGIDPAVNVVKIANERGIPTIAEFFNSEIAQQVRAEHGLADVIIGNNVIAHIDALQDVIQGVESLLSENGVFLFEAPYLKDMFDNLTFDTIYHEHASYLAVRPLVSLLDRFGLEIFDVKTFPVQGVSLRTYAGKKGIHPVSPSVALFMNEEKKIGMDRLDSYYRLAKDISMLRDRVYGTLGDLRRKGRRVAGYGAPAKGNTLLNYFGIGPDMLDHLTEELPTKLGLFSPGMHIPVIHVADSRRIAPDDYLLLTWNTPRAIITNKEKAFLDRGGSFVIPVGRKQEIFYS